MTAFLISGPPGSGKTTALKALAAERAAGGCSVISVIQPDCGRLPDGTALGFDLELLASGPAFVALARSAGLISGGHCALYSRILPLARRSSAAGATAAAAAAGGTLPDPDRARQNWGPFSFDISAFDTALDFVRAGLGDCGSSPLFIGIDEIGPLELSRKQGLWPVLRLCLDAAAGEQAIGSCQAVGGTASSRPGSISLALCVRPALLSELSALLGEGGFRVEQRSLPARAGGAQPTST